MNGRDVKKLLEKAEHDKRNVFTLQRHRPGLHRSTPAILREEKEFRTNV